MSNQTDNSVERRKEEEQAKITSEFAMAQIFEQELKLHRIIQIVKQKIMKTNFEQVIFREQQPIVDIVDDEDGPIQSLPPSEKHLNFIEAFNSIDK